MVDVVVMNDDELKSSLVLTNRALCPAAQNCLSVSVDVPIDECDVRGLRPLFNFDK